MGLGLSRNDVTPGPIFTVRGHRYRFLDTIGQGSAATVYRCEDPTATQYAVKVFYFSRFSPSLLPRKVQSFHKEARILKYMGSRSRHFLYLVEHEYNPRENVGYMILELGDGSLRRNLLGIPLDEESLGMYWKQIVTILKDLQDANVVHADIKPDNLILVNNILKVTDLGLAFPLSSAVGAAQRPSVRGTIDYMAPEVFHFQTGFKSDVWSAGIILYEMTYGRSPYFSLGDQERKAAAISSMTPISFPRLSNPYLHDCLKQCLRFDSRLRPSAYELLAHPFTRM